MSESLAGRCAGRRRRENARLLFCTPVFGVLPLFYKKIQKIHKNPSKTPSFAPQSCGSGNTGTCKTPIPNKREKPMCGILLLRVLPEVDDFFPQTVPSDVKHPIKKSTYGRTPAWGCLGAKSPWCGFWGRSPKLATYAFKGGVRET